MKALFLLMILTLSCNAVSDKKEVTKVDSTSAETATSPTTEDCDDKAKKPIEIKEETISLSNNTGCTLEE